MRIKDMITQDESKIDTSTNSPHYFHWKMYRDNKWEFEFWSEGLKG